MSKGVFFLLFINIVSNWTYAQEVFSKLYTYENAPFKIQSRHSDLKKTSDNGYLVLKAGIDDKFPVDTHLLIAKFDECDNLVWSKFINQVSGKICDASYRVLDFTIDNKGLIHIIFNELGKISCKKNGFYNIKLDQNGNLISTNHITMDLNGIEKPLNTIFIRTTENDDYFIAGNTKQQESFVYKLSSDNIPLSQNIYPLFLDFYTTKDQGYILSFRSRIFKFNSSAQLSWGRRIDIAGHSDGFQFSSSCEINQGFFVIGNYAKNIHFQADTLITIIIDDLGEIKVINKPFWTNGSDKSFGINEQFQKTFYEGNKILYLSDFGSPTYNHQYMISEFDLNGIYIRGTWRKKNDNFLFPLEYSAFSCLPHSTGGYLVSGRLRYAPANKDTIPLFINKIDKDFNSEDCWHEKVPEQPYMESPEITLSEIDITSKDIGISFTPSNDIAVVDANLIEIIDCGYSRGISFGNDTTLCFGDTLKLTSKQNFTNYKWSTGETTRSIEVKEQGLYVLQASNNCESMTDSINVDFHPNPHIDFTVEPSIVSVLEEVSFTSQTPTPGTITWDIGIDSIFNDFEFNWQYDKNGYYTVHYTFEDLNGCTFRDSSEVLVKHLFFSIPNSFTPNDDGLNDLFAPEGFGIKHYSISIFNRWGELTFNESNKAWDGGIAPTGLYGYHITITNDFGKEITKKGMVYLIK